MNNRTRIVIGVAAGLAVGTVLGLLFAPRKGSETRKKILDEGKDLAEQLTQKMAGIRKTCSSCEKTETA